MKRPVSMKWVVLWSLWLARLVRQPTVELRVSSGHLRGSIANDGSHISYLGVPYATAGPEHRFKAPGPEPIWDSVFDAINENTYCRQSMTGIAVTGLEDCLRLNVFIAPDTEPNSRLPVMVFIHGGAFLQGSGSKSISGPEYLVAKGVILVTINYRLNMQGFLCLRTKDAPGNAGMKDQVAALRWIQRNIKAFGGDPDNVTIFGESAGGASVSYHLLSPMSKGLFHKAIMQSGSALAPWAYQLRPVYMASLLAKMMGYDTEDPNELYNIFKNKSDSDLILTKVPRKEGNIIITEVIYAPCTEAVIDGEEPFFTGIPYEMLSKGEYTKIPLLIGSNSEEGLLFGPMENTPHLPKITFEKLLPKDLVISSETERKEVADTLKRFYMGDLEISEATLVNLSRVHGELYFNLPGITETELILNTTDKPVYSYLFDYYGWRNFLKLVLPRNFKEVPGATHADETFYLFKTFGMLTFFENEMIDTMTTLWTNFAKHSDPTPPGSSLGLKWTPNNKNNLTALVIGSWHAQPLWHSPSLLYWRELYQKYRRKEY